MNMFKKNGGFTLVELIVVIAILAILAAVAVPAYSGYITKANEASDVTQLDAIKTAAVFAYTEKSVAAGSTPAAVNSIFVDDAAKKVYVNGSEVANEVNVAAYVTIVDFKSTTYANGAQWNGSTWSAWSPSAG